jgi:hypothetical protein
MTHPTRTTPPTLAEVVDKISDRDMTEMCLAVNTTLGPDKAWRLAELVTAARKVVEAGRGKP